MVILGWIKLYQISTDNEKLTDLKYNNGETLLFIITKY